MGPLSVVPPSAPLGSEAASGSAFVLFGAGSRVWLVPSVEVDPVDVLSAATAYSDPAETRPASVSTAKFMLHHGESSLHVVNTALEESAKKMVLGSGRAVGAGRSPA